MSPVNEIVNFNDPNLNFYSQNYFRNNAFEILGLALKNLSLFANINPLCIVR